MQIVLNFMKTHVSVLCHLQVEIKDASLQIDKPTPIPNRCNSMPVCMFTGVVIFCQISAKLIEISSIFTS